MRRKSDNLKPEQKEKLNRYLETHPALKIIYEAKQSLCRLLSLKARNHRSMKRPRRLPHQNGTDPEKSIRIQKL